MNRIHIDSYGQRNARKVVSELMRRSVRDDRKAAAEAKRKARNEKRARQASKEIV